MPTAAACLLAVGVAVFVQRHDREVHPDMEPAVALVDSSDARTVLTNSPVVAYYLRDTSADVRLDRPFGLGNDETACAEHCRRPVVVVEDSRLPGGIRGGPGAVSPLGPVVVRIVP
jgi:hypothetical protein